MLALNNIINQLDLVDIYKMFYGNTKKYTFFSTAHETFSKIDCVFGHKASLGGQKKIVQRVSCTVPIKVSGLLANSGNRRWGVWEEVKNRGFTLNLRKLDT